MAVEIKSCNTVLTSDTLLYQHFFNPLFLLGRFRFQEYQNESSNFKKYFFSTVFARFRNTDFLKATLWNYFSVFLTINDNKYTWNINGDEITHNFECNHKEADMHMVLHAGFSSEEVSVAATGTDVLNLMVYAYSKFLVKRTSVLRYENDKCAGIERIFSYLGKWYMPWHYWFILWFLHSERFMSETFNEKWTRPHKLSMSVHDSFWLRLIWSLL